MHPIRNPQYRLLLFTRLAANLSSGFFEIAIFWWVLETTGSGALIAIVALVGSLSYIVVAPWGGVLADRYSKKALGSWMYAIDGALTAAAGVLLMLGHLNLALALVLLAVTNTATALRGPALSALLPLILPKESYQQGNATMGLAVSLAGLSSFALAGVATAAFGPGGALLIGAGLILLAALFLVFLREPQVAAVKAETKDDSEASEEAKPAQTGGFREGLRVVWQSPLLLSVVLTVTVLNFIVAPLTVLLAPYADLLTAGAAGFGLLAAAPLVGQLLGLALMNLIRVTKPLAILIMGTVGVAVSLFGLAGAPTLAFAMAAMALGGFCAALMNVQLEVIVQTNVQPALMGRAYGLLSALSMGAQPGGYAVAGVLMAVWPIRMIFAVMAAPVLVMSLAWLRPTIRRQLAVKVEATASEIA
ncbi:MAG: MFS transporter [Truepera sp.]|nr:MFS transporter [Truepera sp.]MBS3967515.1 MFS transporter [Truepera sp.]